MNVFGAPPVDGLGTAGGFKIMIEDRGDNGLPALASRSADEVVDRGERRRPAWQGSFTSFRADTPWLFLDIDRTRPRRWACR